MSAAERDVAAALRAVRQSWAALMAMVLALLVLAADALFIRSGATGLAASAAFIAGLGWWGTAAIRLHGAIRRAERHQESKGEVR